jgi:hypothetical protein
VGIPIYVPDLKTAPLVTTIMARIARGEAISRTAVAKAQLALKQQQAQMDAEAVQSSVAQQNANLAAQQAPFKSALLKSQTARNLMMMKAAGLPKQTKVQQATTAYLNAYKADPNSLMTQTTGAAVKKMAAGSKGLTVTTSDGTQVSMGGTGTMPTFHAQPAAVQSQPSVVTAQPQQPQQQPTAGLLNAIIAHHIVQRAQQAQQPQPVQHTILSALANRGDALSGQAATPSSPRSPSWHQLVASAHPLLALQSAAGIGGVQQGLQPSPQQGVQQPQPIASLQQPTQQPTQQVEQPQTEDQRAFAALFPPTKPGLSRVAGTSGSRTVSGSTTRDPKTGMAATRPTRTVTTLNQNSIESGQKLRTSIPEMVNGFARYSGVIGKGKNVLDSLKTAFHRASPETRAHITALNAAHDASVVNATDLMKSIGAPNVVQLEGEFKQIFNTRWDETPGMYKNRINNDLMRLVSKYVSVAQAAQLIGLPVGSYSPKTGEIIEDKGGVAKLSRIDTANPLYSKNLNKIVTKADLNQTMKESGKSLIQVKQLLGIG